MKKPSLMFLAGILTGIIVSIAVIVVFAPKLMFTVSESKYDFETTKALIEKGTPENKWAMPHQYNLQATMEKHVITSYSIHYTKLYDTLYGIAL